MWFWARAALFSVTMKPRKACMLWLALILLALALSLYQYTYFQNKPMNVPKRRENSPRNISILLWHWPFNRSYPLQGDVCLNMYNIPHCLLTDDRSFYHQADVVVFHHYELQRTSQKLPLHRHRLPTQKWVWMSLEPPAVNRDLSGFNHLFNWTMTYRRDADIPMPYGRLIPRRTSQRFDIPWNHTCLASWVVSNFQQHHQRSRVYQELRKHIPIKVYGSANKRPLPMKQLLSTIGQCNFYLAFENSISRDYITEKLWRNSFQAATVPVVLGPPRSNYEAFMPPDSFIHVDDFHTIKDLASFLKRLAANRAHYELYFRWRQEHDVHVPSDWRERLCHICKYYNKLPQSKVYHDLHGWAKQ